jgi:hypothetical protein
MARIDDRNNSSNIVWWIIGALLAALFLIFLLRTLANNNENGANGNGDTPTPGLQEQPAEPNQTPDQNNGADINTPDVQVPTPNTDQNTEQ